MRHTHRCRLAHLCSPPVASPSGPFPPAAVGPIPCPPPVIPPPAPPSPGARERGSCGRAASPEPPRSIIHIPQTHRVTFTLSQPLPRPADEMRAATAASFRLAPATNPPHRRASSSSSCSLKPALTAQPSRVLTIARRSPGARASLGNRLTSHRSHSFSRMPLYCYQFTSHVVPVALN